MEEFKSSKQQLISEIEKFTIDDQIMSALERVKTLSPLDQVEIMEMLKKATIRIQLSKLDDAKRKYGID